MSANDVIHKPAVHHISAASCCALLGLPTQLAFAFAAGLQLLLLHELHARVHSVDFGNDIVQFFLGTLAVQCNS